MIRRRDAWWLRVRVWRGVFVKIGTRLRGTPDGRIAFAAPTAEVQCEFDEDDDAGSWGAGGRDYWAPSPARAVVTDPSDDDDDEDAVYAESVVRSMRRERARAERARAREANEALARSRREEREEARRREKEEKANARRAEAEYREEARRRDALAKDLKRRARAEREESERRAKAERTRAEVREEEVRRHAAEEAARRARVDAALKAEEASRAEEAALKAAEAILFAAAAADEEELKAGISTGKHVVVEASPAASTDDASTEDRVGVEAQPQKRDSPKEPVAKGTVAVGPVGQKMADPADEAEPDSFAAASDPPPPTTSPDLPPPPVPRNVPTADELRRLERDAVDARRAAEKAAETEKRRAGTAARAARRERERLDALAEEEKRNRERDQASDVRAQAKRALEEKKRREAERAAAEKEARVAAREATRREEKERREEEKKRREEERAEERERRLADAARRRAEAEVRAREEAAAALEAEAEREARRAPAAETRETVRAPRERRRVERATASSSSPSREGGDDRGARESTPSKAAVVSGTSSDTVAPATGAGSEHPFREPPPPSGPPLLPAEPRDPRRAVVVVPGRWIDPGEDAGAPGERALNLVIANRAHAVLGDGGWTVLRPDLASPPLAREQYADFVRAQTLAGVPVLEIHGAAGDGRGDEGRGVTGVIAQDDSALGAELSKTFGAGSSGPASRRDLELINQGAVAVESFDAAELEAMDPVARSARVDAIARDIASAVGATGDAATPEGCSASGCPRRLDD